MPKNAIADYDVIEWRQIILCLTVKSSPKKITSFVQPDMFSSLLLKIFLSNQYLSLKNPVYIFNVVSYKL